MGSSTLIIPSKDDFVKYLPTLLKESGFKAVDQKQNKAQNILDQWVFHHKQKQRVFNWKKINSMK